MHTHIKLFMCAPFQLLRSEYDSVRGNNLESSLQIWFHKMMT
jgi:hypothetical protein